MDLLLFCLIRIEKMFFLVLALHFCGIMDIQKFGLSLLFLFSGILATRVISKPKENLICFDLGHKAIAPEMKMPRAKIIGLENAKHLSQSEEHLVIESNKSAKINVGDIFYAVPNHICPTVAKYNSAYVINHFKVEEIWKISARNYNYEINF